MNTRKKIKLALTVGLLNHRSPANVLRAVRDVMLGFQEVGAYLGKSVIDIVKLNPNQTKETIYLQFEHCTLSLDLISNSRTSTQVVQGFNIR